MAGSYNHVIDDNGNLLSNVDMVGPRGVMIENLGDAYEAVEEMYGMIWWMAHMAPDAVAVPPEELVEMARKQYATGLQLAKQNKNKRRNES